MATWPKKKLENLQPATMTKRGYHLCDSPENRFYKMELRKKKREIKKMKQVRADHP